MERVKGEKYWSVVQTKHGFEVCDFVDDFDEWDNADYEIGNRFPDRESAVAMANKFLAVLKGADVIEMPSEEDLKCIMPNVFAYGDEFTSGERMGWRNCFDWLKSKVK